MASTVLPSDAASTRSRSEPAAVIVDAAGARTGGGARFVSELERYLEAAGRDDVRVIGNGRGAGLAWLLRREMARPRQGRFVALNNVGFVTPAGERWTLLRNPLHFLTDEERSRLDPSLRHAAGRDAVLVRFAARRSDVLVTPSTAMAQRVCAVLPAVSARVVVRPHPVSADSIPDLPRDPAILFPVLRPAPARTGSTGARLADLLAVIDTLGDPAVRLRITTDRSRVPDSVAAHPRAEFVGRLSHRDLRQAWGRCRAVYFPASIESFGYPLAEARASGRPVIAPDTAQNREIGGGALCGFSPGDAGSLRSAVTAALTADIAADPVPFDPAAYFAWLLGTG